MKTHLAALGTAWIGVAVLIASPRAAQQVRDPAAPYTAIGTGVLSGTVMTDETPSKPLRRALVTLNESGGAIVSRLATTDDMGRYTFAALPAGKYTLTASRPPYLRGSYGAHRMVSPASTIVGTTIPLANGQQVTGLTILMQPGAVISGVLRDFEGQPAANASVNLWYYQWVAGTRTLLSSGGFTQSDDRGVYRIYGLAPGEYVIVVVPFGPQQRSMELTTVSAAEIQRAMDLIQRPTAPPPTPQPDALPQIVGWAPVFYPGTTDLAQASSIRLAVGEERGGVDLQLSLMPGSRVEGTVIGLDGNPAPGLQVQLVSANGVATEPGLLPIGLQQAGQSATDRQGRFALSTFAPGPYSVRVGSFNTSPMAFGSIDVVLQGQSLNVTVPLAPLPTVTGRVVFDGTGPAPDMSQVRVNVVRLISQPPNLPTNAAPEATGEFKIPAIVPDRYRLSVGQAGATASAWMLKAVAIDGQDVTDRPFDIRPSVPVTMVVTMTDRVTELSGHLTNTSDVPVRDLYVIAFPDDRSLWTPVTRRIQITNPDHDGRFSFRYLPPGDYRVVAVTEIQQGEWLNPEFLTQLIDASARVVVPDGGKVTQDLKVR